MPSNLKHLSEYVRVYDSKISNIKKRGDTNRKYSAVNKGDIFPSVTESRKIILYRVVEHLMPEGRKREMSYRTIES